jgi:mono/diheme cytochrome c family protein/peroxiredoxin
MSASPRALLAALSTLSIVGAPLAAQKATPAAHAVHGAMPPTTTKTGGYYSFGFTPGERVADVTVTDVNGKKTSLVGLAGSTGAVIVIRDAECPVTQRYSPRLAELEKEFGPKGYTFTYVDVTPHSRAEAKADAAKYQLTGRTILDSDRKLVNALRAASAAESFVIDARGTLRYRGAIDDQYGIDFHKDAPTVNYLRESLGRVSSGRELVRRQTDAPGCVLPTDQTVTGAERPVTYNNRISRLVAENCQSCHRAEGNAPMPLDTYKQVADRRATIEYMTKSGRMPPWFAHKNVGEWSNDRSLSERDLKDLLAWAHNGAPEGSAKDAPSPRKYVKGWNIGTPDAIVAASDTFKVPAQGVVEYKYSYTKTNFDEDKWVTAMEIRPEAAKAVHHVIVFIEEPGREPDARKRKPGEPAPQGGLAGFFAATAPGTPAMLYPEGTAKKLPKGAWLKFQIHYTPNGTEYLDNTKIGFLFADKPVTQEVQTRAAANTRFEIKPYEKDQTFFAEVTLRNGGTMLNLFPHAHTRGQAFKYDLIDPTGKDTTTILDVPHYNFNWQTYYAFKKPLDIPAGSKIRVTAKYDNTKDNPFNPDPSKTVRFGEQTFEEMMIGYFDYLPNPAPVPAPAKTDSAAKKSGAP